MDKKGRVQAEPAMLVCHSLHVASVGLCPWLHVSVALSDLTLWANSTQTQRYAKITPA